jgi:hypothetical protein
MLLENGGQMLPSASQLLKAVPSGAMHLATCRACDFGITRTAGGVLSCATTLRPALLVDEPGHWLGRIQRDQCREAGFCVVVPFDEFRSHPAYTIKQQADQLGTYSAIAQTTVAAKALKVGAERDLAEYLFTTYIA